MDVLRTLIIVSLAFLFVSFSGIPTNRLSADPTDDLSLSLAHAPSFDVYSVMSERGVGEVLRDQLDLFPVSMSPRLAHHLMILCQYYRFDPAFILSLIEVESHFRIKVVSEAGAIGLMQIMPATAKVIIDEVGIPVSTAMDLKMALTDPFFNLTVGVTYLAYLRDHYAGRSPYYILAAYNIGPARMDQLLTQKNFHPSKTLRYYESIRRGVPDFRYYRTADPGRLHAWVPGRVRPKV